MELTPSDYAKSIPGTKLYSYVSLTKVTNIRLLHLQPSDSESHNLGGTLNEYNQEDAPPYECLSYVWGTGKKDATIRIGADLGIIPITKPLERALLDLRDGSTERVLWVDQICINQEDIAERSKQVQRMGRVYQRAKRDVVWLGEGVRNGNLKIARLAAVLAAWRTFAASNPSDEWPEAAKLAWLSHTESDGYTMEWNELDDIFRKDQVWNRVWIVQEILLAKEVMLRCGGIDIDLDLLHRFVVATFVVTTAPRLMDLMLHLQQVCYNRFRLQQRKNKRSLEGLLFDYWRLEATDPRDKIFALLGVARYIEVIVDYSSTMTQVKIDTTKALMKHSRTLNLLCFDRCVTQGSPDDLELPSWVFDYQGLTLPALWPLSNDDFDGFGALGGFSAGVVDTTKELPVNFDEERLEVSGCFVDTLEDVQGAFHSPDTRRMEQGDQITSESWHRGLFEYATTMAQRMPHTARSPSQDHIWGVVSQVLVHDQVVNEGRLEERQRQEGLFQFKLWAAAITNGHLKAFLQEQSKNKSNFLRSLEMIWSAGTRRLALTKEHNLLVTVGTDAKVGDEICVLEAASVPLLLRKSDKESIDTYKQIGTAYVHGVMDGEAWAQTDTFPEKMVRLQ